MGTTRAQHSKGGQVVGSIPGVTHGGGIPCGTIELRGPGGGGEGGWRCTRGQW
jgi:hypothetical protein